MLPTQTPYKILKYFHDDCVVTKAHKIEQSIYNVLLMCYNPRYVGDVLFTSSYFHELKFSVTVHKLWRRINCELDRRMRAPSKLRARTVKARAGARILKDL